MINESPYEASIAAENLFIPWAVAIGPENKIYVTERTGTVRIIENGNLLPEPLIRFSPLFLSNGEGGLMGLALDPDFEQNRYLYVMHTYTQNDATYNRVVRLTEDNNRATIDAVLLDQIPGGLVHNGGRIKFGPDNRLYITTGDVGRAELAQDLSSLAGKILRINPDGSIPEDNPFPGSPVYSYGHRNPQGITWSTEGIMYATEHGQTAHDEINLIVPGGNYGWPIARGYEEIEGMDIQLPIVQSDRITWAPSGIAYISQGPWQGRLLVSTLRGEELLVVTLNPEGNAVERVDSVLRQEFGRLREVLQAEDGSVYLTTSNRDGRGIYRIGDDKVIRLTLLEEGFTPVS